MSSPPLLSIRDLTVELSVDGGWFAAVDGIGVDLSEGESLAVVGETGCGKTLFARALIGLSPEGARVSGSAIYRGRELLSMSEGDWARVRGREIAMMFQEPSAALDPVQTIGAQIHEALRARGDLSRSRARTRARELLAEVSFSDPNRGVDEYPHRLSGGERQRACLAVALAADPAVLLADEPTTALDATVSAEVMELLDRLRGERRLSLILITHDLAAVARHTDRCLVVYAGRVVEEAPTPELFRAPKHPYTAGLLASVPRLRAETVERRRGFRAIGGTVPDLAYRPRGRCSFAPRCPERFEPCDSGEPPPYEVGGARVRCFVHAPRRDGAPEALAR